ncbi:MAG: hypothetical protein AAF599_21435 [Bacteroidota bacterium]
MIQNPKLKAVVNIRNLVVGLSTDWKELKTLGTEIDTAIRSASTTFINHAPTLAHERWLTEMGAVERNVVELKSIMNQVVTKINQKKSNDLAVIWNQHKNYSTALSERLHDLYTLGKTHLSVQYQSMWEQKWQQIFNQFLQIQALADGSSLHLTMIEEYTPDEVDELTDTILRNMPKRYSLEEASQYEQEYMEAYEQLKKEATQKKNLWDRFLDILAGGTQQTPAQRVMMQRWVNGEKGDL